LSTLPENGNEFCRIFFKKKLKLGVFSFFSSEKFMDAKNSPFPTWLLPTAILGRG
jgi:hypothetical protein